jgi:hypothetical protein
MTHSYETCEGPIEGLYLPPLAWEVLHRENIGTIDRLKVVAGQLERFDGCGSKTAQAIRFELARVEAPGGHASDEGQLSPWGS